MMMRILGPRHGGARSGSAGGHVTPPLGKLLPSDGEQATVGQMSDDHQRVREIGPHEATLDAPQDSDSRRGRGALVQLIVGSTPAISGETQCLLRSRLRAASLMLCLGFGVFWLWMLLNHWLPLGTGWATPTGMLAAHGAVTVVLALCAGSLCRGCEICLRSLRLREVIIFGAPAAYFVYWQTQMLASTAAEYQVLPNINSPWLMLIFTYALFIPNTWRRAAAVIGVMAAAPVAITALKIWTDEQCANALNAGAPYMIEHGLMAGLAGISGVFGVHTIGRLRIEAFQAKQLGQYHLRKRLGEGGMGEVYLAEHQLMKRPCAIKLIRPERAGDPTALARFEREVRASAKLSHWNSIDIFDYGRTNDGTFYYVMEYLPGKSLAELVQQYGPMSPARVVYLLRQICDALGEAHGMGLLHRDIKPANIFAAQRGGVYDVAKLLDFGLVKPLASGDTASTSLTQDGAITGSPLYMSPEQALSEEEPDARSDIYSLGAVAYHMLTGRPPFEDDRPLKVLFKHASEPAVPPSQIVDGIPDDLERIVLRCLEKQPEARFASAAALADALDMCQVAGQWNAARAAHWWQTTVGAAAAVAEPDMVLEPQLG